MMIQWNEKSIRLMADSLNYTHFAEAQCEYLLPYLPKNETILEAGSGIGYLSRTMAKHVKKVISVEFDPAASAHLQKYVAESGETRIQAVCGDAFAFRPAESIHTLVCCRFGSMEEVLSVAENVGAKQVLVLTLANRRHRVSAGGEGAEVQEYCRPAVLQERGIAYEETYFTLENGQPFRSLSDAMDFFRMYDRKGEGVTESSVRAALTHDPTGEYQWYYPMESRFRLLRFEL